MLWEESIIEPEEDKGKDLFDDTGSDEDDNDDNDGNDDNDDNDDNDTAGVKVVCCQLTTLLSHHLTLQHTRSRMLPIIHPNKLLFLLNISHTEHLAPAGFWF